MNIYEKEVLKNGLTVGCFNENILDLSKVNKLKVIEEIEYGGDVKVSYKRKPHVVEVYRTADNEVDFFLMSKEEYINNYGIERYSEIN